MKGFLKKRFLGIPYFFAIVIPLIVVVAGIVIAALILFISYSPLIVVVAGIVIAAFIKRKVLKEFLKKRFLGIPYFFAIVILLTVVVAGIVIAALILLAYNMSIHWGE